MLSSIINALIIYYFAERILEGKLVLVKEKFTIAEYAHNSLSEELKHIEASNSELAEEENKIAHLYQITRCLTICMDENNLLKVLKEELVGSGIMFSDIVFIKHKEELDKYKDYEVFSLFDQKKKIGYFLVKDIDPDFKKEFGVFAKRFALSVKRFRLYNQLQKWAITDSLTELYSKGHCLERLGLEIERSKEFNLNLSVAMADIDDFKEFNDRYGHLTGDTILRDVARIIKSSLRNIDFVGRFGGEEFLIIMPEADKNGSRFAAERIRREVENYTVKAFGKLLKITISIGLSSFPIDGGNHLDLIEKADQALYQSKKYGKNKVTLAGSF